MFMEIAYVTAGIRPAELVPQPWFHHREELAAHGIRILHRDAASTGVFDRPYDAMLLHIWLDTKNRKRYDPSSLLPVAAAYSAYREHFPETVQIVLNHTDMSRTPYASPYWRPGDPVLYRTPAYDRSELAPFPPESIWAYEKVWGDDCFRQDPEPAGPLRRAGPRQRTRVAWDAMRGGRTPLPERVRQLARGMSARVRRPTGPVRYPAGFIGQPTGPVGYRERVAAETARVGIGICLRGHLFSKAEHDALMAGCDIIVCPRGWGEQSARHWDAWRSGKPVLTDRDCDAVELVPGARLRNGVHYLVYDDPRDIPDIVTDWTRPSRRVELDRIAAAGRHAAVSCDAAGRLIAFFRRVVGEEAPS
jgi:hypothetical protein